ncbi:MAG: efflux RND transporter periplasmic adaptor subunit, partial [Planctomycetes bacterium]|nr:efflux RND transporter periplasmic adaptor subunit [Planctomycetota bacterium]
MHPQIQLPNPGKCPIRGMDLIPLEVSNDDAGPRALSMSESDRALADIQTTTVERRFVEGEIRMVGKAAYDETKVKSASAWVPGRLDRLVVDYTGTAVSEGDHMVLLDSPKLLEAQGSLIEARRSASETANESSQFLRDSARRHLESEREKLRLWGLTDDQVAAIEERGTVEPHIQISAPLSGVVIHKNAVEGMYVETGTPIYTVADLSVVWLELDAYDMGFSWIRYGQTVEFVTEAHPGQTFEGWISFVPPYLNEQTRTAKVRVIVQNEDRRLKPGMFVRATVRSKLAAGGRVMAPDLADKFICPMHHEIVKDAPGSCDVCGMDLSPATSLGFVTAEDPKEAPIVVPTSAVLLTGRRGVVYVALTDRDRPTYEGREVVVGPRAGDWYVILEGLAEGEVVVTNGNFKIDSALQILAKPSMMSSAGEKKATRFEASPEFLSALAPVFEAYLRAQVALSQDDFEAGRTALAEVGRTRSDISEALPSAETRSLWTSLSSRIKKATEHALHTTDIKGVRALFKDLSEALIEVEEAFGHNSAAVYRVAFCPMAAGGKGAAWIQEATEVENPYFGASMFHCG